jgi:hypothetical protein
MSKVKFNKISVCIPCKNRLGDLKKTLNLNLQNCSSYPNFEFLLLDYNHTDKDDFYKFLFDKFSYHIKFGILKVYRTRIPKYYHPTHSKNILSKQASGSIIVHCGADSITPKGFLEKVNDIFLINHDKKIYLSSDQSCSCGKIAVRTSDFVSVGGYDEKICGYGFTNQSFIAKLNSFGFEFISWGLEFDRRIPNPKSERCKNMKEVDWVLSKNANISHVKKCLNEGFQTDFSENGICQDLFRVRV